MVVVLVVSFLLLLTLGVPIAFSMGASSILSILVGADVPLTLLPQRLIVGIDSFTLLAIPLFILAGGIMQVGGVARRLIDFSTSIVGYIRGGLGISTALTGMVIANVSGSAAADTAAVGSIMIPAMKRKKYPTGLATTLVACAGSLAAIIPPSLVMILYCVITNTSIVGMFLAGIIPGIMMGCGLMILAYLYGRKYNLKEEGKMSFAEVKRTAKEAIWALLMPPIVLGGIITGIFTPTEAAVIAVVYALIVSMFIYREMTIKDLPKILIDSTASTAMVGLIIAGAAILGWVVAYVKLPLNIVNFLTSLTDNPTIMMLLMVVFVLFIGLFIETVAATIIIAPILGPIVQTMGYDPIHFGLVIVATLVFAGITPPVGAVLNIAIGIGKGKFADTLPFLLPFLSVLIFVVILVVFIPPLATFLPSLFL